MWVRKFEVAFFDPETSLLQHLALKLMSLPVLAGISKCWNTIGLAAILQLFAKPVLLKLTRQTSF